MVFEKGKALVKEAANNAGVYCIFMKRHAESRHDRNENSCC
jgi:hypothetical protein